MDFPKKKAIFPKVFRVVSLQNYNRQNFFIPFLAELGNSKHFEPYLFFGQFLVKSAVECSRTVWPGAAGCGRAQLSAAGHGRAQRSATIV